MIPSSPGNLAWFPPLRFAVRPLPPHRMNALSSVSADGLVAVSLLGADLSRLSPGQDVRSHRRTFRGYTALIAATAGPVVAGAEPKPRQREVAGQADAFACRRWPGAGVRCEPGARCEWVTISSAACWASASQGVCPPGTS